MIQQDVKGFNKMWNDSTKCEMIQLNVKWFAGVHVNRHDMFWTDINKMLPSYWLNFLRRKFTEITMKFVGIKFTYGNSPPEMKINYRVSIKVLSSTRNSTFANSNFISRHFPTFCVRFDGKNISPRRSHYKYRLFWGNEGICDLFTEARSVEVNKHISRGAWK
jgi:hypothetical protein